MALRLIKVILPDERSGDAIKLLEEKKPFDFWQEEAARGQCAITILTSPRNSEEIMDLFEKCRKVSVMWWGNSVVNIYVAFCNLARKALYGNSLKLQHKGVVYQKTPTSDSLFRQSTSHSRERLLHNLNGWKKSVFLRPRFFSDVLRL